MGLVFEWMEQTGVGTFVRESPSLFAYPMFLFFHALGLSTIVGISTAVALRLLGFASSIAVPPLERLFPLMWTAFAINAISGSGLLVADVALKMTNPVFLTKLTFIGLAMANLWLLKTKVFRDPSVAEGVVPRKGKLLAGTLLFFWLGAIIAGRLTAYVGGGF